MNLVEKKDKKIAVIIRNFSSHAGGAERYCVELTSELAKNFPIKVYCQDSTESIKNICVRKVFKLSKPRFLNQLIFSALTYMLVRKKNYDIIHSHDMVSFANVYSIHVPTIKSNIFSHNTLRKISLLLSPRILSYLWLENRQMKVFKNKKKAVVAVSTLLKNNIVTHYPKVKAVTSIINPALTHKSDVSEGNILEKYQIPKDAFLIIFVGHGFKRKGLQVLVNALERIQHINPFLMVIGRGDQNQIKFSSKKIKLNTFFFGEVGNISDFYKISDIMVHPTLGDTYGMAILEAMYYKTPVIISDEKYCGIASELDSSNSRKISDPHDDLKISKLILELYTNQEVRSKLAMNSHIFAKNKNWESVANNYLDVYSKIST